MTKTYKIDGMTCGGCVSSVTKALGAVVDAQTIAVSLDEGTATITAEHDESAIKTAVEDAGFDFGGVVS
jgi:copper chaperone